MATTSVSSSSGLDVNAIVTGLMSIERQPITKLNAKQTTAQAKISALGMIQSKVATLQTAAQKLGSSSASSLKSFTTTSSDTAVATTSASSTAVAGTYSLAVTSLAQSQKLVATGQTSSTAAIGSGSATVVTFDLGTISGGTLSSGVYSGATFTSAGSSTHSITIDSSNNTLEGIRDAINAASMGVTATIINDGGSSPYRLALSSDTTGLNQSVKITTDGADSAINTLLANNPAGTQNLTQTVAAQNANFTVNGVAISKTSNNVTDAIQGVSLTLGKITASDATLTVARDTSAVSTAVSDFVTAYNDLYSSMKNSFAYKSGSALAGDASLRSLQTQMREIASTSVSSGTLTNLSDVGITFKTDGTMQQDSAKLTSAMTSNFNDVANLFNSTTGFATRFDSWATSTLAYDGTFASRTTGLNKTISSLTDQVASLEVRMATLQKQYTRQYSSLNAALISMQQTSAYLTRQLG